MSVDDLGGDAAPKLLATALACWHTGDPLSVGVRHVLAPVPDGKLQAFTVHLRARIGKPCAATLFSWGGDEPGVRIFTRVAGQDPSLHKWDSIRQNYLGHAGADGTAPVLEAEIALDNAEPDRRCMRVGVPLTMVGADRTHDIALRFTGPKLELFVDGVLVDVEWPIGRVPVGDRVRVGGSPDGGDPSPGFDGSIGTAAIWDRALSDDEVTELAGGAPAVAIRDREILGPENPRLQYFTPRGHNAWAGDTMCFYRDGRFHLLYLADRRLGGSKFGCGAHRFAHASSADLVAWTHHPMALDIDEQYETFGTGYLLFHDNKYYLFYGMHSYRTVTWKRTLILQAQKILKETGQTAPLPFPTDGTYPMGSSYAVSADGVTFEKSRIVIHPAQNPSVFADSKSDGFLMLAGYGDEGFYSSTDFRSWKREPPLIPYGKESPLRNSSECQCCFEWNGWHYIIAGRTGFWMARDRRGPYFTTGGHSLGEGAPCVPRWDIYDGLFVPMVAPFKDNRRILAGWLWKNEGPETWGGFLVFRELVQYQDGTLGLKWPAEMIPESGPPMPIAIRGGAGVRGDAREVRVASNAFAYATIAGLPRNAHIALRVEPGPGTGSFGVCVGGHGEYEGGCELQFFPGTKQAQWGVPRNGLPDDVVPDLAAILEAGRATPPVPGWRNGTRHLPFNAGDFAVTNVEGLDSALTLELIVKQDKSGGTIVDACIDNRRTMITWRKRLTGDRMFLFCRGGAVLFRDIVVRELTGR
jgi:hypothetical protein